jgi:hypothetical protein
MVAKALRFFGAILLLSIGYPTAGISQTTVAGAISGTWTKVGSPYVIIDSSWVASGDVLTIESGVTVWLGQNLSLHVFGKILAVGTPNEHIVITSPANNPAIRWNHIYVQSRTSGDTSEFVNCDIRNARVGIYLMLDSWACQDSDIMVTLIRHCNFSSCDSSAIVGESHGNVWFPNVNCWSDAFVNPIVENCTFNSTHNGCFFLIRGEWAYIPMGGIVGRGHASPTIRNNLFLNLDGSALLLSVGDYAGESHPVFANNNIVKSHQGILAQTPYFPKIDNNIFMNDIIGIDRMGTTTQDVTFNCFFDVDSDFVGFPPSYGSIVMQNQKGDPCDVAFNIFLDPRFADTTGLNLSSSSPCIDAGDPVPSFYDVCLPPSQGTEVNDIGALGGPAACGWNTAPAGSIQGTVQTNPVGDSITVDGVKFQSPQTFTWSSGTGHTIGTDNVQVVGEGTRHLWKSWSDGGTISHTVTPTNDTTFTANFMLQYYLTTSAGAGGTVTPSSNWLNSDSTVTITAIPSSGNSFDRWTGTGTGSYTGTDNPASVTMQGPITEVGAFVDRTPPVFAGLQYSSCEMNRVRLVWRAATDPSVPIKYYVYKATSSGGQDYNQPDTTTTDTTVVLATLSRFQAYYFVVRAEDAAGNRDTNRVEHSWFAPPVGDFTCDNKVDGQDLAIFAKAWREQDIAVGDIGPVDSIPPYLRPRPDGRIDFEDLVVFGLMWNWSLDYSAALQSGPYTSAGHVEREVEVSFVEPTVLSVGERKTYSLVLGGIKDIQTASIRFEYDGRRIRIDSLSVNADSRTIVLKRVDNGRGYALVDVAGLDGTMDTRLLTKGFVEVSVTALAPIQEEPITVVAHTYSSKAELTSETVKQIRFNSASSVPRAFSLQQNYPNPFNPSTTIGFAIPVSSHVTLTIIDLLGRRVETLIDENREAGEYKVQWNAANLSSGLYFYRLKAAGYTDTKKLILLR